MVDKNNKSEKINNIVKNLVTLKKSKKLIGTDSTLSFLFEKIGDMLFTSPIFTTISLSFFFFFSVFQPLSIMFFLFFVVSYHILS